MSFELTPNVHVTRDESGRIVHLSHVQEPYRSASLTRPTEAQVCAEYLEAVAGLYGLEGISLRPYEAPTESLDIQAGTEVRFEAEKRLRQSTTTSYRQTHHGLAVWDATLQVHVAGDEPRVTSSASTLHHDLRFDEPHDGPGVGLGEETFDDAAFAKTVTVRRQRRPEITRRRLLWYRFDPDERTDPQAAGGDDDKGGALTAAVPTLALPDVPDGITPGVHYLCWEVLFTLDVPGHRGLNWRALAEVNTGAVLYLRALTASASGCVYATDPITQANSTVTCASANSALNPLRTTVSPLEGLKPPTMGAQALSGDLVEVVDTDAPTDAPPTAGSPYSFCYDVKTTDFSAVNAYHHSDLVFRMVEDMGFVLADYFDGTTFPVPVDHAGMTSVNAQAPGNATGTGLQKFRFGLACPGGEIGIAADQRVVLHEFGHALLWDHVGSPNFGFAHSAGDALAAILHDPASQAGDRFATFPWLTALNPGINRRHDRDPGAGWAWFGTNWNTQYGGEQVLSTTLFRLYRSLGGDATWHLPTQRWASRYTTFVVIKAIGTLSATTPNPEVFATALMNADLTEVDFEGQAGGAVHKVVRWAFEKQGLYRPAGTPTPWSGAGDPPAVDVFIDDGRNGEYGYQANFWSSQDIWNRLAPDAATAHQTPVTNTTNYLYVRVRNRGSQPANDVTVRCFHCEPGTGLVWPDDWAPVTTAQLSAPGPIPAGGSTVVGPFQWTPEHVGHECLLALAAATGDPANDVTVNGPIAHSRFVPFDNNIGQRNVAPVAGGGGLRGLLESLRHRRFLIRNPFPWPVRVRIEAHLPELLAGRGWGIVFENAGGQGFSLPARGSRHAMFSLTAGQDFTAEEAAAARAAIDVVVLTDDLVDGGMTYLIDHTLTRPPREVAEHDDVGDCQDQPCQEPARALLECLSVPTEGFKRAQVRAVSVDFTFGDC